MKCFRKTVLVFLATILIVSVLVLPAFAAGFDFQREIDNFTPRGTNVEELTVGETDMPGGSIWVRGGAECMTSDDSVVRIDPDNGEVTAVGVGSAYIAIVAAPNVYQVIRYDVVEQKSSFNAAGFFVGLDLFFAIWFILFFTLLLLAIYSIVTAVYLSVVTMKEKGLPLKTESASTVRQGIKASEICPVCSNPFGDSAFCSHCGTAKHQPTRYEFPIAGKMNVLQFEKMLNQWLAENPYIYDCKLHLKTHASLWRPFVMHKFFVKKATVEFFVSETPRSERYGFAFLYSFRPFGPLGFSEEKQVEKWLERNAGAEVLSSQGGHIQHFGDHGFYAQYYHHILFKK